MLQQLHRQLFQVHFGLATNTTQKGALPKNPPRILECLARVPGVKYSPARLLAVFSEAFGWEVLRKPKENSQLGAWSICPKGFGRKSSPMIQSSKVRLVHQLGN